MTERPSQPLFVNLHRFAVVGVNHRTCPDAIREKLYVADEELPVILRTLRVFGVAEAMSLSTCDRVEIAAVFPDPEEARRVVARVLCAPTGLDPDLLEPLLYRHIGGEAVHHLFRVAASLDSQVVGEPQVLGQLRACHRLARGLKASGPLLDAIVSAAFEAAKQVRTETAIAEGPVSLTSAAIAIAREVHGNLAGKRAALIGAGEMGCLLAEQLQTAQGAEVTVLDRLARRAEATARTLGAHFRPYGELAQALADSDIVVAAVGEGRYVLTEEMVRAALAKRRFKPIYIVDLSMPADVDPALNRVDEAFLFDIEDLERTAVKGKISREAEARAAEALVERAVARFLADQGSRGAAPIITSLRSRFEAERRRILADRPGADAEEASRLLINRLLHLPSERLRGMAADDSLDERTVAALANIFGLDEDRGEET